jgi:hypothetical protein
MLVDYYWALRVNGYLYRINKKPTAAVINELQVALQTNQHSSSLLLSEVV